MMRLRNNKLFKVYLVAIILLLISIVLGVGVGASKVNIITAIKSLAKNDLDNTEVRILLFVRLPRVISSLICGMALAVSGAVIQGVLANKLASPSIIGVNAGAGLAVTICSAFGIMGGMALSLFSFLGAFIAVMIVTIGAKRWGASRGTVILMGVALNALLGAISDVVITFNPEVSIFTNDFKIGDFSHTTYSKIIPAVILISLSFIALLTLSNELEVLMLGDENAKGLGVNTSLMRAVFLLICALLAGSAVSIVGLLSFVGLLVPHAVRKFSGTKTLHLIIMCALFGAGFVTLCDTLARVVFLPYELPVGIILALIGAPFFIFILVKGKGGKRNA